MSSRALLLLRFMLVEIRANGCGKACIQATAAKAVKGGRHCHILALILMSSCCQQSLQCNSIVGTRCAALFIISNKGNPAYLGGCPRHGEDDVQGHIKRLSTVGVSIGRWVGHNGCTSSAVHSMHFVMVDASVCRLCQTL
jgi:hypothetical protein